MDDTTEAVTGFDIAAAFMGCKERKGWRARNFSREKKGSPTIELVIFETANAMVRIEYNLSDGRFAVAFNKFQGAWGDYIKAISRSMFTVLNTLKSCGLGFEAPTRLAGMVIECTTTDDTQVYVRWVNPDTQALPNNLNTSLYGEGDELPEVGLVEGLEAIGLHPIVIDEDTDFSQLPPIL